MGTTIATSMHETRWSKPDKQGKKHLLYLYALTGTQADLDLYCATKGDNLRRDTKGNPVWFATAWHGKTAPVRIAEDGRCWPDLTERHIHASIANTAPDGKFGDALAKVAAERYFELVHGAQAPAAAKPGTTPDALPAPDPDTEPPLPPSE